MTRIGLIGAGGRMGRAIAQVIAATPDTEIAGGVDRPDAGTNEIAPGLQIMAQAAVLAGQCDVLVDFSSPSALPDNLAAALAANTPIVIGTTGLEAQHHALIADVAAPVAVLQAAKPSLGVNMLWPLVGGAAARLGRVC